jgi:hypothetical protein
MALVLADRVQQTATANTTVSFTLSGSVTGFQSFSVIGNTNTTYYAATDGSGNWEVGIGTYSTTGPTLTRTTILSSSNSGSAVTFSGTVNVFVTYPSGKSVSFADVQTFTGSGTWTKPSTTAYQFVRIQMWGGGGGGSRANTVIFAAGGGGGYYETTIPIASMGATATVTVGGAGTGRTASTGLGTDGGNSAVTLGSGSIIYASGGKGAANDSLGGAGGYGALTFTTSAVADPSTSVGNGASTTVAAGNGYSYTGGGGAFATTNLTGGSGGWGGGGGSRGTTAGGTSIFGGAGGNASGAGTQPGGGAAANTNATNGGAGQVIITTF